jgi:hypothetical protein
MITSVSSALMLAVPRQPFSFQEGDAAMKCAWVLLVIPAVGCSESDKPLDAVKFPNGEVTHVAFAEKGKSLVAVNEFAFLNSHREKCHTRLRRFSTSDWKIAVDSGELSLVDFTLGASDGPAWTAQANDFDRMAGGNPILKPAFYKLDPATLEYKAADKLDRGVYWPSAIAQPNAKKPICGVHWKNYGERQPTPPAFIFDVDQGKKTVELEDFPTAKREEYFTRTVLEFTPDGKQIVSCHPCKPYQLQLHASDTGKLVASMKLEAPATALKFLPSGEMLAALCLDGTVLIFAKDLSKSVHTLKVEKREDTIGFRSPHSVVFPDNENMAVISGPSKIEFFDTKDWKSFRTITVEKNQVNCIASSPDGKLVAAGLGRYCTYPTKVRVYEVKTGNLVTEID